MVQHIGDNRAAFINEPRFSVAVFQTPDGARWYQYGHRRMPTMFFPVPVTIAHLLYRINIRKKNYKRPEIGIFYSTK